ncbi:MAG TPA: NusA-like transcription termination signal-binding factor [Candidatus Nanoarchaeia archaeon]|nr:NusA-like transcription termination signal-binding factor [Candidatus Nanoarchaeia archaeon]
MNKITFDSSLMQTIALFERTAGSPVKDCILQDSTYIFILPEHSIAQAIGRQGSNVRRLQQLLNRKVKLVEFSPDPAIFIQHLIQPLRVKGIAKEGKTIVIASPDIQTKGLLIGRDSRNLKNYEAVVKRHFDIEGIRVV